MICMVTNILTVVNLASAVLLIVAILLQQKGAGMGAAFGGSGSVYTTRRGLDRTLFQATIVLSVVFFATAIAFLLV